MNKKGHKNLSSKTSLLVLIAYALIFLPACNVVNMIYGIKRPQEIDKSDLIRSKYLEKENEYFFIKNEFRYFLDTLKSKGLIVEQNYHFQPLKVYYYQYDSLISIHVNCYTGGFPNLKWNRSHSFDVFPAISQFKPDSLLPLSKHLTYIEDINGSNPKISGDKFTVLIYWNVFMGRQTKIFLKTITQNLLIRQKDTRVIYVNNDHSFLDYSK